MPEKSKTYGVVIHVRSVEAHLLLALNQLILGIHGQYEDPDGDDLHLQLMVVLDKYYKNEAGVKIIKKAFSEIGVVNAEAMQSNNQALYRYVTKPGRVEGTEIIKMGLLPLSRRRGVKQTGEEGERPHSDLTPNGYPRFTWIEGTYGIEKSNYALDLIREDGRSYHKQLNGDRRWCRYQGQPIIFIDELTREPKRKIDTEFFHEMLGRIYIKADVKNGDVILKHDWVIIVSNYSIDEVFGKKHSEGIKRRITDYHIASWSKPGMSCLCDDYLKDADFDVYYMKNNKGITRVKINNTDTGEVTVKYFKNGKPWTGSLEEPEEEKAAKIKAAKMQQKIKKQRRKIRALTKQLRKRKTVFETDTSEDEEVTEKNRQRSESRSSESSYEEPLLKRKRN